MSEYIADIQKLIAALSAVPVDDVPARFSLDYRSSACDITFEQVSAPRHPDELPKVRRVSRPYDEVPVLLIDDVPYHWHGEVLPSNPELIQALTLLRAQWPYRTIKVGYYNIFFDLEPVEAIGNLANPFHVSTSFTPPTQPGVIDALIHSKLDLKTSQMVRLAAGRHLSLTKTELELPTRLPSDPDVVTQARWMLLQRHAKRFYGRKFPHQNLSDWIIITGVCDDPEIVARLMKLGYFPAVTPGQRFVAEYSTRTFNYFKRPPVDLDIKPNYRSALLLEALGIYNFLIPGALVFGVARKIFGFEEMEYHDDSAIDYDAIFSRIINELPPHLDNKATSVMHSVELSKQYGYVHHDLNINLNNLHDPTFTFTREDLYKYLSLYPKPNPGYLYPIGDLIDTLPYEDIITVLTFSPAQLDDQLYHQVMTDPAVPLVVKFNAMMDCSMRVPLPFTEMNFPVRLFYYLFDQPRFNVNLSSTGYYTIDDIYTNPVLAELFELGTVYLHVAFKFRTEGFADIIRVKLVRFSFTVQSDYIFLDYDGDVEIQGLGPDERMSLIDKFPSSTRPYESSLPMTFFESIPFCPELLDYLETTIHS